LSAVGATIEDFRALDTEPYGVNPGDAASHRAFIERQGFPFDLLVDEGRLVADAYGAVKPDGSGIQRTVVIIGKDGRVIFREQGAPPPADLLDAIRTADDA
jgi:peroxiredoxin